MGADAPPLTISDTPSPYSPPPAADYIAPGEGGQFYNSLLISRDFLSFVKL